MSRFQIGPTDFELDGQPVRIISGALHYFRVFPELWADRIEKVRLLGLNAIETYIPWNAHSPSRGEFRTDGMLDLARFIDLVHAAGLYLIIRPGPYICAEWNDGGLPRWLTNDPSVTLRRNEPNYLAAVTEYVEQVASIVAPRQIDHGGPVILYQIENEYGAYADDHDYLRALAQLTRDAGITVPFITVDQPTAQMLADGGIPEIHRTGSFGSAVPERLATLREFQPSGPLMCSEYWIGWFDSWGEYHHETSAAAAAQGLDQLLSAGASVNIYMLHGGTNFGTTNGANDKGVYRSIITSYDYSAPLAEDGTPTDKFWAFRDVIGKYRELPEASPAVRAPAPAFSVELTSQVDAFDVFGAISTATVAERPLTLAQLGSTNAFTWYQTQVTRPGVLHAPELRDRAQLFLNGSAVALLDREQRAFAATISSTGRLDLLVEDLGGVNYGVRLGEDKGLLPPVDIDGVELTEWQTAPIDLSNLDPIRAALADGAPAGVTGGPLFAHAEFTVPGGGSRDLFLDSSNLGKGLIWVNGFCLGRHWTRGPQRTLFVPGPLVNDGVNELLIFETLALTSTECRFVDAPDLGAVER
ncbi:MAG TPA: beta-galactosidase family protein [Candidatus Lumbricidophila sp.]|nr:beta-galactosidase family protein [Candidatus Lumbricidophila sp.]